MKRSIDFDVPVTRASGVHGGDRFAPHEVDGLLKNESISAHVWLRGRADGDERNVSCDDRANVVGGRSP